MADTDDANEEEIVLNFLARLPATDGGSLPFLILVYAGIVVPKDHGQVLSRVRAHLTTGDSFERAGRLIATIAYIDQILFAWIQDAPRLIATANTLVAREPDVDTWQQMCASAPLRAKHTEQTYRAWQALRQSTLSLDTIRLYVDRLTLPTYRAS